MTKEELEKEATEYAQKLGAKDFIAKPKEIVAYFGYLAGAEPRERRIAELEEKISVLLSCKNCPENKGGYICAKEYENKCLAQKIEFIKELQQENAELKSIAEFQQSSNMSRHFENKKLKEGLALGSTFNKALNSMNKSLEEERDKYRNMVFDKDEQLTKAKEIIKNLLVYVPVDLKEYEEAKQFLNKNSTYERIQKAKYNYTD